MFSFDMHSPFLCAPTILVRLLLPPFFFATTCGGLFCFLSGSRIPNQQ
jgi:hypothetical protein